MLHRQHEHMLVADGALVQGHVALLACGVESPRAGAAVAASAMGAAARVRWQWQGGGGGRSNTAGQAGRRHSRAGRHACLTHRSHQLYVCIGVAEAEPAALHRLARLGSGLGARGGGVYKELAPHQLCTYTNHTTREKTASFESSSPLFPRRSTHTTPRHSRVPVSWQARSISSTLSNWTWQKELSLPVRGNEGQLQGQNWRRRTVNFCW